MYLLMPERMELARKKVPEYFAMRFLKKLQESAAAVLRWLITWRTMQRLLFFRCSVEAD